MKRIGLFLFFASAAFACPKQRADVKNMTDAAAAQIGSAADIRSISDLAALKRPSDEELKQRTEVEKKRFRVTGTVTKVESEADGDMKLFVSSGDGAHLVAEIPETECVAQPYRADLQRVKKALRDVKTGSKVTLEGVGYWGYIRADETAPNGIQLHPVLSAKIE